MGKADHAVPRTLGRREFLASGVSLAALMAAPGLRSGSSPASTPIPAAKLNRPLGLADDAATASIFKPALAEFDREYAPLKVQFLGIAAELRAGPGDKIRSRGEEH